MLIETAQSRRFRILAETRARLQRDHPAGTVFITSIDHNDYVEHKPGVTFGANYEVAARMINGGTHRESTPEEVIAYNRDLMERTAQLEANERLLNGQRGTVIVSNKLRSEIEDGGPKAA